MQAWAGWAVPVVLAVAFVVTLVLNGRRYRAQQFGTLSERRAAPTRVIAGYAVTMTVVYLGVAVVVVCVVLVTQGRGFTGAWWSFLVIGVVLLGIGLVGRARFGAALRRARRPLG